MTPGHAITGDPARQDNEPKSEAGRRLEDVPTPAPAIATQSIESDATVASVFAVLADPSQIPRWAPDFADAVVPVAEKTWRATSDTSTRSWLHRHHVVTDPARPQSRMPQGDHSR